MAKIVITEFMDQTAVDLLADQHSVVYDPTLVDDRERTLSELTGASALLVRNRTQVNTELLAVAPNLKVVGRLGVGLDNIDMDACEQQNVAVCPARGANDRSVAEYVITAALVLLRTAWYANAQMMAGEWPRARLMGQELTGKCLGIIGFGAIARDVARLAQAFGMDIIAYDPYLSTRLVGWGDVLKPDLDEIYQQADVLSLHLPLTDETTHLLDGAAFKKMKTTAILINAARGGIVDEPALVEALQSGQISGAALDVFEREPLSAEDGAIFQGLPNILLTPHIAGVTVESNSRVSRVTAENVLQYL